MCRETRQTIRLSSCSAGAFRSWPCNRPRSWQPNVDSSVEYTRCFVFVQLPLGYTSVKPAFNSSFTSIQELFLVQLILQWIVGYCKDYTGRVCNQNGEPCRFPYSPTVISLSSLFLQYLISELSNELRTTTVGLEHLAFPYAFPQPPAQNGPSSPFDPGANAGLESWMYYLSETSLRRVGNEIISTLYSQEPLTWTKDIPGLCVRSQQLLDKLDAW